ILRTAKRLRRVFEDIIVPVFGHRPIAEVTKKELMDFIDEVTKIGTDRTLVKRGARKTLKRRNHKGGSARMQALALFSHLKTFFSWELEQEDDEAFGLEKNPLDGVRKGRRIGTRTRRDRTLTIEELTCLVLAIERQSELNRKAYRVVLHAGLRINEGAKARNGEM